LDHVIEPFGGDENTVNTMGADDWGELQILKNPQRFCRAEISRVEWVLAFHKYARLANSFAGDAFREELLTYLDAFDCRDQLEPRSAALLNALVISMKNSFR